MVENIQEIEPVVKKESVSGDEKADEEEQRYLFDIDDPAQMKLEL